MSAQAIPAESAFSSRITWKLVRRIAVVVAAVVSLATMTDIGPPIGLYWAFGLAFGVILQRSRLCFASAFRDVFLLRDGRNLQAVLVGIAVATLGFALIMAKSVPDPSTGAFPNEAHVVPVGLYLVVGGLLFGVGMVVAGGCISGTLYRVGEGYVGSFVALGGILVGLEVAAHTWNWWWAFNIESAPMAWLPNVMGYAGAVMLTLALLGTAYVLTMWWESGRGPKIPLRKKSEVEPSTVPARLRRTYQQIFVEGWSTLVGAVALAILNVFAFTYEHPLGVTGELGTWADRAAKAVGLASGPLLGADRLAGCNLVLATAGPFVTNNFALDAGLVFGAFVSAVLASEFKLRFPRQRVRYGQSFVGGTLMGYGAGLAAGCTIGAFFSAIPSLGLNGWIFGLALLGGAFGGVQVIKRIA